MLVVVPPTIRHFASPTILLWYGLLVSVVVVVVVRGQPFDTALSSTCAFTTRNRRAVVCQQVSPLGVNLKYTIPCPRTGVTSVLDCLGDRRNICLQQNNIPCLTSFYCADTNRFAGDCSNIQSRATGSSCSSTDCFGNCLSLVETVRPYSQQGRSNACDSLDSDYYIECSPPGSSNCEETSRWRRVLGDGIEVDITTRRQSRTCDVRTSTGGQCTCSLDCPGNSVRYDCSQFSRDPCATWDCQRQCINGASGPPPPPSPVVPDVPFTPLTPPFTPLTPPAPINPFPQPIPLTPVAAPVAPAPTNPIFPLVWMPNSWTAPTAPRPSPAVLVPTPTAYPPSWIAWSQSKDKIESAADSLTPVSWLLTTTTMAVCCLTLLAELIW